MTVSEKFRGISRRDLLKLTRQFGVTSTLLAAGGFGGCLLAGPMVRRVGHARVFATLAAMINLSVLIIALGTEPGGGQIVLVIEPVRRPDVLDVLNDSAELNALELALVLDEMVDHLWKEQTYRMRRLQVHDSGLVRP